MYSASDEPGVIAAYFFDNHVIGPWSKQNTNSIVDLLSSKSHPVNIDKAQYLKVCISFIKNSIVDSFIQIT